MQYTGGVCIHVNSYMERDRGMMERVIRAAMSGLIPMLGNVTLPA